MRNKETKIESSMLVLGMGLGVIILTLIGYGILFS